LPWCAGVPVRRACRTGTVPLAVELIEGHGAGGDREPGRDARMPPGVPAGLRDGRAAGRVPADPWRSAAGRRTPPRNHRAGRGSRRRPDARERRGGAGRCGPGSPGYRRVRLPGASRPVPTLRSATREARKNAHSRRYVRQSRSLSLSNEPRRNEHSVVPYPLPRLPDSKGLNRP